MQFLGKSKNKNDNDYYELYWDSVSDTDGRKYKIVCCTYSRMVIFGIVYSSEGEVKPSYFNTFNGEYIPVNSPGYTTYGYKNNDPSIYNKFNSTIKKGFIAFEFTRTGGYGGLNEFKWYDPPFLPEETIIVTPFLGTWDTDEFWKNVDNIPAPKVPWQDDPSKPGGGEGKWDDDTSDDIDLPNIDDLNENAINATQFMTLYQLSQDQLKNLGKALWSGNFLQALSNSALKPMDYILSFCMLPVYAGGTVKTIKAGGFVLSDMTEGITVNGTVTTNQYVRVDCGELEINEKWGGAIDYQTDLTLYLPFIGMVKLSPQDVMNGKIKVVYTVDLLTGNCIATVKVTKGVLNSALYNFTGNCSSSYPLSSRDFSTVFGSLITASSSIMGAATATKNASSLPDKTKRQKYLKAKATESATSSWEGTGMQATNNLISGNFSPDVVRCGTMSANVGFMGIKKPFLIISRLKQSLPDNFGKHAGYMCNVTKKLADCKGFTQVRFIHLDGIIATNTEKNELDSLLKEGVIIE